MRPVKSLISVFFRILRPILRLREYCCAMCAPRLLCAAYSGWSVSQSHCRIAGPATGPVDPRRHARGRLRAWVCMRALWDLRQPRHSAAAKAAAASGNPSASCDQSNSLFQAASGHPSHPKGCPAGCCVLRPSRSGATLSDPFAVGSSVETAGLANPDSSATPDKGCGASYRCG